MTDASEPRVIATDGVTGEPIATEGSPSTGPVPTRKEGGPLTEAEGGASREAGDDLEPDDDPEDDAQV